MIDNHNLNKFFKGVLLLGGGVGFLVWIGVYIERVDTIQTKNKTLERDVEQLEDRLVELEKVTYKHKVKIENLSYKNADIVKNLETSKGEAAFDLGDYYRNKEEE